MILEGLTSSEMRTDHISKNRLVTSSGGKMAS